MEQKLHGHAYAQADGTDTHLVPGIAVLYPWLALGTWQPTSKKYMVSSGRALSVERDTMTDQNNKTVLWLASFFFFFF